MLKMLFVLGTIYDPVLLAISLNQISLEDSEPEALTPPGKYKNLQALYSN